ncbi:MAG TPA: hypothetical protein V6C97_10985 [Oculatellaceae cyanobacterium]
MKPSRRRKGATLGLVAACVLVIIALGFGVFFLAKLFGGGRELANATDAGTLNLAKNALVSPSVNLASDLGNSFQQEFGGCSYNVKTGAPDGTIDLFTYNRCVGQALLVAMNAKAEADAGSTTAMGNAQLMLADLNTLGLKLAGYLNGNDSGLQGNFQNGANANNVGMFGNTTVKNSGSNYATAYMKSGGATNIWFSQEQIPYDSSSGMPNQSNMGAQSSNSPDPNPNSPFHNMTANNYVGGGGGNSPVTKFYMQGYQPITVSANGYQPLTFYGVPVFPQQKPHLVSVDDFNGSSASPDTSGSTPPNAFRINANAQDKATTGQLSGAVACAIVGAVFQNNGLSGASNNTVSPDFPVTLPTGYIEINNPLGNQNNGVGGNLSSFLPSDASSNIFNNELYASQAVNLQAAGPGGGLPSGGYGTVGSDLVAASTTDGVGVFGDYATIAAWAAYNGGAAKASPALTPDPYNGSTNPGTALGNDAYAKSQYPPKNGFQSPAQSNSSNPSSVYYGASGTPATLQQLLSISYPLNYNDCTYQAAPGNNGLSGLCLNYLNNGQFNNAYGHNVNGTSPGGGAIPPGGISAVDTIKGIVLANFNGAGYHKNLTIGSNPGTINNTTGLGSGTMSVTSVDGNGNTSIGPGNSCLSSTGLGEYMGGNGLADVLSGQKAYASYDASNASYYEDSNVFPMQNTGSTKVPDSSTPSILGLLSQLENGNGPAASGDSSQAKNDNVSLSKCGGVYYSLLARVQQIQPKITDAQFRALLNGKIETGPTLGASSQYGLQMGQTAYIFLNNANLNDTSGPAGCGIHIYACNGAPPSAVMPNYTAQTADGSPGSNSYSADYQAYVNGQAANGNNGCSLNYALYQGGAGLVDVSIDGNSHELATTGTVKGDDFLHEQPYTQVNPGGEFTATDTAKWVPSSGYKNLLGRLNFSDVVSGSATFSAPN